MILAVRHEMKRCKRRYFLVVVAAMASMVLLVNAELSGRTIRTHESKRRTDLVYFTGFESEVWTNGWKGVHKHRKNMRLVDSKTSEHLDKDFKGKALEVTIEKGQHYGIACELPFKEKLGHEPESLYVRFYTYYANDFGDRRRSEGYRGKAPGFDGTYGIEGWGGKPNRDGTKGWSCRGSNHGRSRRDGVTFGFYTYEVQTTSDYNYGKTWQYRRNIPYGKWVCIEQYIKLNTPGKKDGVARAWIDDKLVFEKTNFHWRNTDALKIESYWLNYYRGGKQPAYHDHHVFLDNLVIAASRRVGPEILPQEQNKSQEAEPEN